MLSKPSPPRHGQKIRAPHPLNKVLAQATPSPRIARWFSVRRCSALLLLLLSAGVVVLLASRDVALQPSQGDARAPSPAIAPIVSKTHATLVPSPNVTLRSVSPRLYRFPPKVGLMQPSVDAQGHIWIGEMTANRLARVDPQTGRVSTWQLPNAESEIMMTTVDQDGQVWFVEQNANYIGRFDPQRQTFRVFKLGPVQGRQLGPQALQFDASGQLWFTAPSGGQIGRLDPRTGTISLWAVPTPDSHVPSNPFSLAVTSAGQVWFGMLTGGMIGHLDPATGQIILYHLTDQEANVFSMTSDVRGRVWFTELDAGKIGWIDPTTDSLTELPIPATLGKPVGLYGVVATRQGDIWVVCNGVNSLLRYEPESNTLTFVHFADPQAAPYGLALDAASRLWFTSSNVVGELTP